MITIPLNLMSIPFIVLIWTLDSLLFLVVMRLAVRRFERIRGMRAYSGLVQLTEPLQGFVKRTLCRSDIEIEKPWLPWFLVVVILTIGRYLILGVLLAIT